MALAVFLLSAAGNAFAGSPRVHGQVRDSAGVRIVEHAEIPDDLPAWAIGPEPQLRIGALDGVGAEVFGSVAGVVARSDGVLVVGDGRNRELRAFDSSGVHLWTSGRRGEFVPPYEDRAPVWWDFDRAGLPIATAVMPPGFEPDTYPGFCIDRVRAVWTSFASRLLSSHPVPPL